MRRAYPSDVSREQFEAIRYILERASKVTHPMDYDIYDIFCAVLYVVKEGCRWRSIPPDYPKWQDVYYHFRKWKQKKADGNSTLDEALNELVLTERIMHDKQAKPTMTIIDSKSVKNAFSAEQKGYDGGKKNIGNKDTSWS